MLAEAVLSRKPDQGLRPFDMRRDLQQLADLIDLAFVSETEPSRSSIVAEMRRMAKAGPFLWLLDASYAALSPLMGGFVWIDHGRLAGNVTLSAESGQRVLWTITNVAVHPDFRGQGIGHELTKAALDQARNKGARSVVLEVETDNAPAQQLYHELGFERYDTKAELSLPALRRSGRLHGSSMSLRKRRANDWQRLYDFFRAVTPAAVQAIKPVLSHQYRMDIGMRLNRWLDDWLYRCQRSDWILEHAEPRQTNGAISAVLQITGQYTGAAHRLQMDVHPEHRGNVEDQLLAAGLDRLRSFPERDVVSTVSTSHSQGLGAFQKAGFRTIRTLDQMVLRYSIPLQRDATPHAVERHEQSERTT
jgi:ribosomal protein S18 acetylase RimI-like enzyme